MVDVEQWAEIRRMHFVDGVSIREIRRRTGLHRETIRRALAAKRPPAYRRAKVPSKLDPFKEEIERLLRSDHRMPGTASASCSQSSAMRVARRSSTTTCARSVRAWLPGAPTSAPSTGPGRSASRPLGAEG